nr:hypothetical protein [uncultured Draconibacterium sp.]
MMRKFILFTVLVISSLVGKAQLLQLSLNGMATFNETQLMVDEAGEDINATIESNSSVYLSVYSYYFWEMLNGKWQIYVHKRDVTWNDEIILELRREGKGRKWLSNGTPNIHDGSSYFRLTNNPTYFFRGRGLVLDIPMGFRLSNVSLTMGANDFETDVVFTIYDD